MISREDWELWSFISIALGLPLSMLIFLWEQRKSRLTADEEVYSRLADEYISFQKLVLDNADLHLGSHRPATALTPEQQERKHVMFDILTSLFERAYILVYEDRMNKQQRRLWQTWEDYMRYWCRREDYRTVLPEMLLGEDPDFITHIQRLAAEECGRATGKPS
ncbi:MAG: hypothetical protein HY301_17590 [Verrucomicrobia bacterium]|nr:hypothetical protein [Verrucomicrobiota bacterium]